MTAALISCAISCVVSFVVGGLLSYMATKGKRALLREKAEMNGMRELLRSRLIEYHDKYTERGYCPIYAKEAATRSYEAYHDLGGNGVITALYEEIMELPTASNYEEEEA